MSKKILLTTLILACSSIALFSQNSYTGVQTVKGVEIGLSSGAFYEQRLSSDFSLRFGAGYGTSVGYQSGIGWYGSAAPYLQVAPRWYYNIGKRENNGLNVSNNAASYITLNATYTTSKGGFTIPANLRFTPGQSVSVAPAWGMQCNLKNNFLFKTEVGVAFGAVYDNYSKKWTSQNGIHLDLGIAYVF